MKYLKTYKLFESNEEDLNEILDTLTDFCLELKDSGDVEVDIFKNLEPSIITRKKPEYPLEVLINPVEDEDEDMSLPTFEVNETIINVLQNIEYYLEQINWDWHIQIYITEDVPEEEWGEKDIPLPDVYDVFLDGDEIIYDKGSNPVEGPISQLVLKFKPTL